MPLRRAVVALLGVGLLVGGYGGLDAVDVVPGALTLAPLPTVTLPAAAPSVRPPSLLRPSSGMPVTPVGAQAPLPDPTALRSVVSAALGDPAAAGSVALVRDALTGATLLDLGSSQPRVPASTTKLLSALAVQRTLPDGTTLPTVVRAGSRLDRVVLVAGGDTLLSEGAGRPEAVVGHAGLGDLADQVANSLRGQGVTSVAVQIDASFAAGPTQAPTWPARFRATGITGPVAALGLATQRAAPDTPGPADPSAEVARALAARLTERGIPARLDPTPPPAQPGPDSAPTTLASETPPPSAATTGRPMPPGTVLGQVSSAPVTDLLALAMEESDNALTEALARVAAARAGRPTDFAGVGAFVRDSVSAAGVDVSGVRLVDASGLSAQNALPPRVLVDVLAKAATGAEPGLSAALRGLPVAGLTGTLAERFRDVPSRPGAGWVRAKTGTLQGVNTLAGLATTADGRLLVFAVMQQGEVGTLPARAALDRFAAALASCGCRQ